MDEPDKKPAGGVAVPRPLTAEELKAKADQWALGIGRTADKLQQAQRLAHRGPQNRKRFT